MIVSFHTSFFFILAFSTNKIKSSLFIDTLVLSTHGFMCVFTNTVDIFFKNLDAEKPAACIFFFLI